MLPETLERVDPNIDLLKNTRTAVGMRPRFATMSARELFPILNAKRLASRPVVGQDRGPFKIDKTGRKRYLNKQATPVFGEPTFRNIIEKGRHI